MTANTRVKPRYVEPVKTGFRFRDFVVALLCLSVVAYSINLFRLDLFNTINLQNVKPVGTLIIKNNTVQRRIADRVLWDRLSVESPVYLGDLIRVADMSSAVLNIEGQQIDLGENTLIRIQLAPNGEGLQIELSEGNIGITVTEESVNQGYKPLQLNMNGRVVETSAGASITASASNEGTSIQVNEGTVTYVEGTSSKEIASGEQLSLNNEGIEVLLPSLVVTQPHFNARYEKNSAQGAVIFFTWNRINMHPQDLLRLEIAADRNFSRDLSIFNDLDSRRTSLEKILGAGDWNWRFIYENEILTSGRLTVFEIEEVREIEQIINVTAVVESKPEPEVIETPAEPEPPPPPPPPPFAVPLNRLPVNGQVYSIEQLRTSRNIVFSWSAVQGANAYIVTILHQTASGRRQVNSVTIAGTRWTLDDISILGRGTFIWQVEAVTRDANGAIERRGRTGENIFTMDIPAPRPVQMDNPGVLYGQ